MVMPTILQSKLIVTNNVKFQEKLVKVSYFANISDIKLFGKLIKGFSRILENDHLA